MGGLAKVIESDCIFFNHPLIEKQKVAAPQAEKKWAKNAIVQDRHIPRIRGKQKQCQNHNSISSRAAGRRKFSEETILRQDRKRLRRRS